jgi:CHAD domain-containing protein
MAFELHPARSVAKELARILREQVDSALAAASESGSPSADRAHRVRVACKRLRAVLQLLRGRNAEFRAREDRYFRATAHRLSALRDSSVVLATFDECLRKTGAHSRDREVRQLRRSLVETERTISRDLARSALEFVRGRMQRAAVRAGRWKVRGNGFQVLAAGFAHAYRQARQAFHQARKGDSDEVFHTWRKCAKAHGYQLRLLRGTWPVVMKPWEEAAKRLARILGDEHDLALLRDRMRRHAGVKVTGQGIAALLEVIATRRGELRTEAIALGNLLFAERPAPMTRRLCRWWTAAAAESQSKKRKGKTTQKK